MNYDLTPAQARARYFIEHVTDKTVDADLDDSTAAEWLPLLDRRTAAQFLGVGMKWLSDISGNGPRGGRLPKVMVRGKVYWRLEDLQAYREGRKGRDDDDLASG